MFIYFLQRKFFLDNGDGRYLQNKLAEIRKKGDDFYYEQFLKFFLRGLRQAGRQSRPGGQQAPGMIKYLNGGLFLLHPVEQRWPKISVPDKAFENLFALFERYSWNLNDTPGGEDNEINPDVSVTSSKNTSTRKPSRILHAPRNHEYLCERTIHRLILNGVNTPGYPVSAPRRFDNIGDLLINLDTALCKRLLHEVLPDLRLLDPACGSAAFLVRP